MFLSPLPEGRGRIVSAMLSQADGDSYPTLSIDVQQGTHIPNGIYGTARVPSIHGAQIKVFGDAVLPFMAQLMLNNVPVILYPLNGGSEEAFQDYCRRI